MLELVLCVGNLFGALWAFTVGYHGALAGEWYTGPMLVSAAFPLYVAWGAFVRAYVAGGAIVAELRWRAVLSAIMRHNARRRRREVG